MDVCEYLNSRMKFQNTQRHFSKYSLRPKMVVQNKNQGKFQKHLITLQFSKTLLMTLLFTEIDFTILLKKMQYYYFISRLALRFFSKTLTIACIVGAPQRSCTPYRTWHWKCWIYVFCHGLSMNEIITNTSKLHSTLSLMLAINTQYQRS